MKADEFEKPLSVRFKYALLSLSRKINKTMDNIG